MIFSNCCSVKVVVLRFNIFAYNRNASNRKITRSNIGHPVYGRISKKAIFLNRICDRIPKKCLLKKTKKPIETKIKILQQCIRHYNIMNIHTYF